MLSNQKTEVYKLNHLSIWPNWPNCSTPTWVIDKPPVQSDQINEWKMAPKLISFKSKFLYCYSYFDGRRNVPKENFLQFFIANDRSFMCRPTENSKIFIPTNVCYLKNFWNHYSSFQFFDSFSHESTFALRVT